MNLETKEIVLNVSKTGQVLPLPMAPALADYFESLPSVDDPSLPVFPIAAGFAKRTGTLSNQFYKVMEQAGLVEARSHVGSGKGRDTQRTVSALSFHSLRHSAVTFLKAAGVSDAVAQAIAGHGSAAISRVYTHLSSDTLRSAVNKLENVTVKAAKK